MELEIRLMKWKWMLFSEALKSIFLSSCLAFSRSHVLPLDEKNSQEISREEAKMKFIRSIASRPGALAADSKSGESLHMKGNRVNQGL